MMDRCVVAGQTPARLPGNASDSCLLSGRLLLALSQAEHVWLCTKGCSRGRHVD
jgi:hypothetical protein